MTQHRTYTVVIENAAGNFSAYVPDLPGCVATGGTAAEAEANIRGAIALHLEGMVEDGEPIPPARTVSREVGVDFAA